MNLGKLFERLSYGEFQNLALSGEGSGTILAPHQAKVLSHVNDGLLELYSRFVLRKSELLLEQQEAVSFYRLSLDYAVSNLDRPVENPAYLKDTVAEPFKEDVLKVMAIYDECGQRPLNDANDPDSLFTPELTVIQVPSPVQGKPLSVLYQAAPIPLALNLTANIDLPAVLHGALQSYVAYKVFFHMNGQEHGAKAAEHQGAYEAACSLVVDRDLVSSSSSRSNTKFSQRGFV